MNPIALLPARLGPVTRPATAVQALRLVPARIRHGRPAVLALRTAAALALAEAAVHSGAGPAPAAGMVAGIITWLALTARADLAPPPDGMPWCPAGVPHDRPVRAGARRRPPDCGSRATVVNVVRPRFAAGAPH